MNDAHTARTHPGSITMNILVIEDDEMYADLVRLSLKRNGFESTIAGNAIEGMKLARELNPDAIVMDVALPQMDGLEAVARIREDAVLSEIPIVVATASGTSQTRYEARQAGADMFLEKPFPLTDLIAALRRVLDIE